MKLKSIEKLTYDAAGRTLAIKGQNSLGKQSTAEIPVESPAKLLSYLASAMLTHPDVQSGLFVDRMDVVTTKIGEKYVIRLILYSMNMRLDFLIRREFSSQAQADEQSRHLVAALELLLSPGRSQAN